MKFSLVLVTLAATANANAVIRGLNLLECGVSCVQASVKKLTSCDETDLACICKHFSKIQGEATGCIIRKCGVDAAISAVVYSYVLGVYF